MMSVDDMRQMVQTYDAILALVPESDQNKDLKEGVWNIISVRVEKGINIEPAHLISCLMTAGIDDFCETYKVYVRQMKQSSKPIKQDDVQSVDAADE